MSGAQNQRLGRSSGLAGFVHAGNFGLEMLVLSTLIAIGITLAAVLIGIAARRMAGVWWRYRGPRVVTCPENQSSAAVRVDAGRAALTAAGGVPDVRLSGCSRWPERADCGRGCLRQVEASPEGCRALNILTEWYEGRYCVACGRPVSRVYWTACHPALLIEGASREWNEIPMAQLPETLRVAQPICFPCHVELELSRRGAREPLGAQQAGSAGQRDLRG